MLILCLDTSGADCAVLLARDGVRCAALRETAGRGHAERLAPMARAALAEAGVPPGALGRIAAISGPGSFAGLRVGIAFARGLALTLDIPALGVSLFDLIVAAYPDAPHLAAAHDAGRGEMAIRLYRNGAMQGPVQRLMLEDAVSRIAAFAPAPLIAGSGAAALAVRIPGARAEAGPGADLDLLARIAAADPAAYPPSPFYLRPPDAKLPGGVMPPAARREPAR